MIMLANMVIASLAAMQTNYIKLLVKLYQTDALLFGCIERGAFVRCRFEPFTVTDVAVAVYFTIETGLVEFIL